MRLTLHTDYALRMLVYLAINEKQASRVSDVAASYRLSRNHLLKVALNLSRLGYVTTSRGRNGGISLARPACEINLGAVVRAIEEDFSLVECLRADGGSCVIAPVCRLKGVVQQAMQAFLAVLDRYTIADLTRNRELLVELLQTAGPETGRDLCTTSGARAEPDHIRKTGKTGMTGS
ncbi:Rrf2 family transcriptional regulator [Pseudohoeflea coraliihabitans]|uniref:Rrf2 family transcriptional regulator n=1 Tax=Pseudohoeflea coraliihabitans TaxID=2860393 RepID=A0ABS6WQQ5_9HYPH|nr:Rrf2 family transcriptional regulator [Pseudohoeflea sp. DP4N28-3]MBW3098297.1 Rrf2 family transcriptional regulator [Pseudohoeflea sp. DP4N28-3]